MVNYYPDDLDHTFAALADPTRRAILARLASGEASVGELAAPFEMSLPAVSKHLRVLVRAGLLAQTKDGRVRRCRLVPDPLREAQDWIDHYRRFWEQQFDALESYLQEADPSPSRRPSSTKNGENTDPEEKP